MVYKFEYIFRRKKHIFEYMARSQWEEDLVKQWQDLCWGIDAWNIFSAIVSDILPSGKENYQKYYIYPIVRRMLSYRFVEQTTKKISHVYETYIW